MTIDYEEITLLVAGTVAPFVLAADAFLRRRRIYAAWARRAYGLACVAGFGWGVLGFILLFRFPVSRHVYFQLLALKHLFAGLALGFIVSVAMAHPYVQNPVRESPAGDDAKA